jgi:hypothetical protein
MRRRVWPEMKVLAGYSLAEFVVCTFIILFAASMLCFTITAACDHFESSRQRATAIRIAQNSINAIVTGHWTSAGTDQQFPDYVVYKNDDIAYPDPASSGSAYPGQIQQVTVTVMIPDHSVPPKYTAAPVTMSTLAYDIPYKQAMPSDDTAAGPPGGNLYFTKDNTSPYAVSRISLDANGAPQGGITTYPYLPKRPEPPPTPWSWGSVGGIAAVPGNPVVFVLDDGHNNGAIPLTTPLTNSTWPMSPFPTGSSGVAVSRDGTNKIWFSGGNGIFTFDGNNLPANGSVGSQGTMLYPKTPSVPLCWGVGVACDYLGNDVFVADWSNLCIRHYNGSTWDPPWRTTLPPGLGGVGVPRGIATAFSNTNGPYHLYVVDAKNLYDVNPASGGFGTAIPLPTQMQYQVIGCGAKIAGATPVVYFQCLQGHVWYYTAGGGFAQVPGT